MSNVTLPNPLSELFEAHESAARLNRVWYRVQARRRRQRFSWPKRAAVASAVCLLALGAWIRSHYFLREGVVSQVAPVDAVVEPAKQPRELDFGDGAHVTVGPGARLEVLEQAERTVTLALRRGLAQFDIRPGGVRRWSIESAGIAVEVVGTQFSVERSASAVRVEVQRGRVLVRGARVPDQVQALEAGRVLIIETAPKPVLERDEPSLSPPASPPALNSDTADSVSAAAPARSVSSTEPSASWQEAALAQDWHHAWESLGAAGVAEQSQQSDRVADLFMLADVARRSGHPESAVVPLEKIVDRHPQDPQAGVAAFTLGRLWIDALGNPAEAVHAFRRALLLELPATLAEDAQARLVQALAQSGDPVQAHAAAERYRSRYVNGARRADVDRWSPPE